MNAELSDLYSGTYTRPSLHDKTLRRASLAPFDGWNERAFAILVAWQGFPKKYLDLGSGTGAMVNMARKMGIESYGIDVINGPEHWFIDADLGEPLILVKDPRTEHVLNLEPLDIDEHIRFMIQTFDLITCVEVAEHIPAVAAPVLVESIGRHLKKGGLLVFSAAPPGQKGEHHVNCQPATYWREMLYDVGVSYREDLTIQLSHIWSWVAGPMSWLGANVQVFDK